MFDSILFPYEVAELNISKQLGEIGSSYARIDRNVIASWIDVARDAIRDSTACGRFPVLFSIEPDRADLESFPTNARIFEDLLKAAGYIVELQRWVLAGNEDDVRGQDGKTGDPLLPQQLKYGLRCKLNIPAKNSILARTELPFGDTDALTPASEIVHLLIGVARSDSRVICEAHDLRIAAWRPEVESLLAAAQKNTFTNQSILLPWRDEVKCDRFMSMIAQQSAAREMASLIADTGLVVVRTVAPRDYDGRFNGDSLEVWSAKEAEERKLVRALDGFAYSAGNHQVVIGNEAIRSARMLCRMIRPIAEFLSGRSSEFDTSLRDMFCLLHPQCTQEAIQGAQRLNTAYFLPTLQFFYAWGFMCGAELADNAQCNPHHAMRVTALRGELFPYPRMRENQPTMQDELPFQFHERLKVGCRLFNVRPQLFSRRFDNSLSQNPLCTWFGIRTEAQDLFREGMVLGLSCR